MDSFLIFFAVGFVAQLADGALGMGFCVISSSVLLSQGLPPPLVSATVNAAKVPTGSVASLSHALNRNINYALFRRLALVGMAGGVIGALIVGTLKQPYLTVMISAFLLGAGSLVLWRGVTGHAPHMLAARRVPVIGAFGGLMEGIGGSWGPIVTSSLIGIGTEPRRAIGSSALAELVVAATVFAVLLLTFRAGHWGGDRALSDVLLPVAGLVAGGIPAAFIGGRLAAIAPKRPLTIAVGLMVLGIGVQQVSSLF